MKRGFLAEYFTGVVAKRLRAVEVDPSSSNTPASSQHEFNGTKPLRDLLGIETGESRQFPARFIWMGEATDAVTADGEVTWYDARLNHATRSEYRLYYQTTSVSSEAREGDTLFIGQRPDGSLIIIVAQCGASIEAQLRWLFNIQDSETDGFTTGNVESVSQDDFSVRFILDELGIDIQESEEDVLDHLLVAFDGKIPATSEFSEFARSTITDVSPIDDPDGALTAWLIQEEKLFKRMEYFQVANRIEEGFSKNGETDVEGFLQFSLSVQNRRKSRAGHAFEHHIEAILKAHEVRYVRGETTENRSKPDFLFPGIAEYRDPEYNEAALTMLGAKTTCKDRWRQVLTEAARLEHKHLLTIEPAISVTQTDEMNSHKLQLVVPKSIQSTFQPRQQTWLLDVSEFIALVKNRDRLKI